MSISLDIALFLRDNGNKYPTLSLSDRGVLYTLAFRVGSNAYCWISQDELAEELNINQRNTRRHTSNLHKLGLILIKKDKKDKRKSLYQPADFLLNYHQKRCMDKKNTYQKTSQLLEKNTGQNQPVNMVDTGQNQPVYLEERGQYEPVNICANSTKVIDNNEEFYPQNGPKETYKNKTKEKANTHMRAREEKTDNSVENANPVCVTSLQEIEKQKQSVEQQLSEPSQPNTSSSSEVHTEFDARGYPVLPRGNLTWEEQNKWADDRDKIIRRTYTKMDDDKFPSLDFRKWVAILEEQEGREKTDIWALTRMYQLLEWRDNGVDIKKVIEKSCMNGWKNLYPPERNNFNGTLKGNRTNEAPRYNGREDEERKYYHDYGKEFTKQFGGLADSLKPSYLP